MRISLQLCLSSLLALLFPDGLLAQVAGPICQTQAGQVQGTRENKVLVFRGIPYARQPGRFLPPQPVAPWAGVRPATTFGPIAAQVGNQGALGAEECLTLNVWSPSLKAQRAKAVVVWVHGGSFTGGSGNDFSGATFATDSVVAVSINYRLGSLGFLQLSHLLGPAYRQSANAGLLDAVQALRWVHTNIAAFGGDPARVTVMGESAGAKLVGALAVTPAARNLFQQIVLESGATQSVRDTVTAVAVTQRLLQALNLRPDQARALLTLPVADLMQAQAKIANGPSGLLLYGPVVDGLTINEQPLAYLQRPNRAPIRMLLGTNRDEAAMFMGFWPALRQPNPEVLTTLLGTNGDAVWQAYQQAHNTLPTYQAWLQTTTDYLYRLATHRFAHVAAQAGQPVWLYRFDYQPAGGTGPIHAQELGYVWNSLSPKSASNPTSQALATQMHQHWVRFITTGNPGKSWPRYTAKRRTLMVFDSVSRASRLPVPYQDPAFPDQAFRL